MRRPCASPARHTVPPRPERPEAVPLSHIANAAGTADPFNNPTLRSPGDAGWGQRHRYQPSPDGRPLSVPHHCPTQSILINIHIIIQKQPKNHCPTRPTMHIHSYSTLCPSDHSDYFVPPPVPTLTHCPIPLMHGRPMARVLSHPPTWGDARVARVPHPIGNQQQTQLRTQQKLRSSLYYA